MSRGYFYLLLASAALFAVPALSQTPSELRETAVVTVVPKQVSYAFPEPIKCDGDSNVYYRVYQDTDDVWAFPVIRISPGGKAFVFPTPSPQGRRRGIIDFAPAGNGQVGLLTTDYVTGRYLDFLDESGQLQTESKLPADIEPRQMAVLAAPSLEIFLSGTLSTPGPEGTRAARPFAGIFDSRGSLQREVPLSSVVEPKAPVDPSSQKFDDRVGDLSSAQSSENGNFVLTRMPSDGTVRVISPGGQELNVFRPAIPEGASLSGVQVDGNTVVALSIKKKPGTTQNEISDVYISLSDAETGKEVTVVHHSSPHLGAALACYKAGVFTFLTADDQSGELQIVRATAR